MHVRRRTLIVAFAASLVLAGCSASRLRDMTVEVTSTLTDLQYQLVLDNLAMMTMNPALIPWHAKLDGGTVQISDDLRGEVGVAASQIGSIADWVQGRAMVMPGRQRTLQWDIVPVTDPKELRDLQAAYQMALGYSTKENLLKSLDIPTGWFEKGTRDEVPPDAVYTGQYRQHVVWVTPAGIEGLSKLTLIVLSIVEFKSGERSFNRGVISRPR